MTEAETRAAQDLTDELMSLINAKAEDYDPRVIAFAVAVLMGCVIEDIQCRDYRKIAAKTARDMIKCGLTAPIEQTQEHLH